MTKSNTRHMCKQSEPHDKIKGIHCVDVDGDGLIEIIVYTDNEVCCLDGADGSVIWERVIVS